MTIGLNACVKTHGSRPTKKPEVIIINQDDMQKLPDGSYKVSKNWMIWRMKSEEMLMQKLEDCRSKKP